MARPTKQKARKEWRCSKSGRTIEKGEEYWRLEFAFSRPIVRAIEHPFSRSETTQSEYLSSLYSLQDNAEQPDTDSIEAGDSTVSTWIEDLKTDLEDLRDECEERRSNMPEHLQDASGPGEILTERIDALESAIDEMDDAHYDAENAEEEMNDFNAEDEDEDEETYMNERRSTLSSAAEKAMEALNGLE